MANLTYAGVWCRGFQEETMLELFERLLETLPASKDRPEFTGLIIRALDSREAPLEEHDLRGFPPTARELMEMAADHLHADCAYEVQASWDLWTYDAQTGEWKRGPQRLELICQGPEYDGGVCGETGHIRMELGMEHLFTGHGNLLGARNGAAAAPQHPAEAEFLRRMSDSARLREYHAKTRENILALLDWMQKIETSLPVERFRLWSEGEENFEARLDEILALR